MKSSGFSIAVNSVLVGSMCGNIADPLRNVKKPEKTVEPSKGNTRNNTVCV